MKLKQKPKRGKQLKLFAAPPKRLPVRPGHNRAHELSMKPKQRKEVRLVAEKDEKKEKEQEKESPKRQQQKKKPEQEEDQPHHKFPKPAKEAEEAEDQAREKAHEALDQASKSPEDQEKELREKRLEERHAAIDSAPVVAPWENPPAGVPRVEVSQEPTATGIRQQVSR